MREALKRYSKLATYPRCMSAASWSAAAISPWRCIARELKKLLSEAGAVAA